MTTTPRLGITELEQGETVPETTVNEMVRKLEQMGNTAICTDRLTSPPGSPVDGRTYLIIATATGAWAGKENQLALRVGTGWSYATPIEGTRAYVQDENAWYQYDGSAWAADDSSFSIDDATDVNIGTPNNGEALIWDGTEWVASPLPGGGVGGTVPDGGTTGQVLTKASGVDQDVVWVGFQGARVRRTSDQAAANYTTSTAIPWQETVVDTDSFWSAGTPSRLTIPTAYNGRYIDASASVRVNLHAADTWATFQLRLRNSSDATLFGSGMASEIGGGNAYLNASLVGVPVSTGDYLEVVLQTESDTSIDIESDFYSGMALRVI